jgi:nifR3 family TIM-barrel protein
MLQLGDLHLDVPFFQASLSGYSDRAMRLIARNHGAPLTFAGVMLAKIAMHPRVFRKPAFAVQNDEHPIGAQLLGSEPDMMVKAAQELTKIGYDLIDLNFACPAPKVLRRRRGGEMLNEPDAVIEIYRRVREAVTCPVLMKLRIGFDDSASSRDNFWKICEQADKDGIDALIIHGRTVAQKFTGRADWDILSAVKRRFPRTTVIGSGDVFTPEAISERLSSDGVDGLAVARGAVGNPWIFRDARALLEGKSKPPPPSIAEQGQVILTHFDLVNQLYDRTKSINYFRKFSVGYAKHHPERKAVQRALTTARNHSEFFAVVREWYGVS